MHQATSAYAYVICPKTAGRFAPVAAGTFAGSRCHVIHASNANAAASLASAGNPNCSIPATAQPSGSSVDQRFGTLNPNALGCDLTWGLPKLQIG